MTQNELDSDFLPLKVISVGRDGKRRFDNTRNQWKYLNRYVIDGRAPADNNILERDIRPFATARNSWLFADTVTGAKASAIVYSLVLTCRACKVEPYAYLHHVLTALQQRAPGADISDLLQFSFANRVQLATTAV